MIVTGSRVYKETAVNKSIQACSDNFRMAFPRRLFLQENYFRWLLSTINYINNMKRTSVYTFVFSLILCGCINFNPKGEKVDEEVAKEEVVDIQKDDAEMDENTHLKFKGVPIDGTLEKFVSRMKRKGFKHVESLNNCEVLEGDFADFKKCTIYVSTLDSKDLVSRISVAFPEQEQWEYLYGDYKYLKELLTEKYGKPSECVERFQSTYGMKPQDNQERMLNVGLNNCTYETHFAVGNGEIVLWIGHDGVSSCYVMLSYKDKINGNAVREHAKDDL